MSGFTRDPADQDDAIEPIKRLEGAQTGLKRDEYKKAYRAEEHTLYLYGI